jgi:hypothetical protein
MYPIRGGISRTFEIFYENFLQFLPNFLAAVILLVVGFILAAILRAVFLRIFRAVKVDRFWERAGMREVLTKGGIRQPLSVELSVIVYWLTVIVFLVTSLNTLHLPTIQMVMARFFLYLPNVFVAVIILIIGYLLSNFFARAALITLVNAGVINAGMIARFVRFAVLVFSLTMALEQLEIGRQTVLIAFAIMFGGITLGFAIAFGLGAQTFVKDYLGRRINKDEEQDDGIDHI